MHVGASGRVVIEKMAELGEKYAYSNLATHRPHVQSPEQTGDVDRLVRSLEAEADAAPPTVEALYRELIRSVKTMPNRKPASAQEAVRLVQSIKELTNVGPQQRLLGAYMGRAFSPGGALHADTPTVSNGRLTYYRDEDGRLVEILDGRYRRTLPEGESAGQRRSREANASDRRTLEESAL